MSGVVFHHISEGIMAQNLKLDVNDAYDSLSVLAPEVKDGNVMAANYVLSQLGVPTNTNWGGAYQEGRPVWGKADLRERKKVVLTQQKTTGGNRMPDVRGMGARDAVYLIESKGVKTHITGRGKVVKQSLEPGHIIKRGERCYLTLEI